MKATYSSLSSVAEETVGVSSIAPVVIVPMAFRYRARVRTVPASLGKPEQGNIFFKLMEERYHCHSTIITTNLVYDEWHNFLGNKSMVDALLSRVRHYCHTVNIDGPSLRELQG